MTNIPSDYLRLCIWRAELLPRTAVCVFVRVPFRLTTTTTTADKSK